MSKSVRRVTAALEAAGLATEIREMREPTRTAAEAAAAVGCALDQIAKSVIFRGRDTDRVLLFVTAGGNRVDAAKAAALAGEPLAPADAAFIRARTGFVIGGVAPLGHLEPPHTFFDARLLDFALIWAAAGTPRHVFPADPAALLSATGGKSCDFSAA